MPVDAELRRVILALEPAVPVLEGAREAAGLAAALGAPLLAIYGASADLDALSRLPVARHVSRAGDGRLDADRLAREHRLAAQHAREVVEQVALSQRIQVEFSAASTTLARGLQGLVTGTDLLVVQRRLVGALGRDRTIAAVLALPGSLLLLDPPVGQRHPAALPAALPVALLAGLYPAEILLLGEVGIEPPPLRALSPWLEARALGRGRPRAGLEVLFDPGRAPNVGLIVLRREDLARPEARRALLEHRAGILVI